MKINRLFEIIYLLMTHETITSNMLADKFEVSTRTIYRDVETLAEAGIPIYMSKGKGGGISILPSFVLDKTVLTDKEKENILVSLNAFKEVDLENDDTILKKIGGFFGDAYTDWIEIEFSHWYNCLEEPLTFQKLKKAILSRKCVCFNYSNAKGLQSNREVEPLKLCFKGSAWYLYSFCKNKRDFRFFKLRRIKELKIINKNSTHLAPSKVLKSENTFNEECFNLKMKISSEFAYRVYEEFKHYKKLDDGSFIAEIDFPKKEWVFYYVASFGADCEVLEPKEIRDKVRDNLKKMLEFYD